MSTVTAQILIGHPDTFHAGIRPTHGLCLFENSRPSWVLSPLMVYHYAVRDEDVRAAAPRSLDDYPMDLEVFPSRYVREVDGWKGGTVRRGSLCARC